MEQVWSVSTAHAPSLITFEDCTARARSIWVVYFILNSDVMTKLFYFCFGFRKQG